MGLKINYQKSKDADDAFKKVKVIITPEYISKFQVKAEVSYDDANRKMKAQGAGFTLELCFLDDHCDVDLDLSFLLRPLRSKILDTVEGQIKKNL